MGPKNVATVKHKIMSILNTAFQLKEKDEIEGKNEVLWMFGNLIPFVFITDFLLKCWDSFVRTIDFNLVGPILAQIVSSLMLIFDTSPTQVASIMKFIVIENREKFKWDSFGLFYWVYSHENVGYFRPFFNRLNFVTEYAELKEINEVIRS